MIPLITSLLLHNLALSTALPSWRYLLPNGDKVACPEGALGCQDGAPELGQPQRACFGLGHATCAGGSLPLNVFGQAFAQAGFAWTEELCKTDSDGDGETNGQELGDPCCEWRPNDVASPYMARHVPTHPGVAYHNHGAEYATPKCGVETAPIRRAGLSAVFQPGEERRMMEWRIKNFTIPAKRTVYTDFYWNFDDDDHDVFHIAWGEAMIDLPKNLHHFVVTGCSSRVPDSLVGVMVNHAEQFKLPKCNIPLGGWAPGSKLWDNPSTAGMPIGKGAGVVAIKVHFTDADIFPGISTDGIRLFYTPTLRSSVVKTTNIIRIGQHGRITIPPGKGRFFVTRRCTVSGSAAIPLISAGFHAHLIGAEMYQTLIRKSDGVRENLKSQPVWHYDDQRVLHFIEGARYLHPGDVLEASCVFNSLGRTEATRMSVETVDEMCFNSLNTLHNATVDGLGPPGMGGFTCERGGHLWLGEMDVGESGFVLQDIHPESKASDVYEMAGAAPRTTRLSINDDLLPSLCFDDNAAVKLLSQNRIKNCSVIPDAVRSRLCQQYALSNACCATCAGDDPPTIAPIDSETDAGAATPQSKFDADLSPQNETATDVARQHIVTTVSGVPRWVQSESYDDIVASLGTQLVFNYESYHDVVRLKDAASFAACDGNGASLVGDSLMGNKDSGYAYVLTEPGDYFFACSAYPFGSYNHCRDGQKLKVTVLTTEINTTVTTEVNTNVITATTEVVTAEVITTEVNTTGDNVSAASQHQVLPWGLLVAALALPLVR